MWRYKRKLCGAAGPPCGWSRDQNVGHVTKQAGLPAGEVGTLPAAAPRDRTKVMAPVGKDKIKIQRDSGPIWPPRTNILKRTCSPLVSGIRSFVEVEKSWRCVPPRWVPVPQLWKNGTLQLEQPTNHTRDRSGFAAITKVWIARQKIHTLDCLHLLVLTLSRRVLPGWSCPPFYCGNWNLLLRWLQDAE